MQIIGEQEVSLYFHIPFCKKKCPYCHFYVVADRDDLKLSLVEALHLEWEQKKKVLEGKKITSIYFGGGTPTLLKPSQISDLLSVIKKSGLLLDDAEITIEANPEDGTFSLFEALLKAGINRLSIGVQSLDDPSLLGIGRGHGSKKAKDAIFLAHQAGFRNISIDLMYDLPDQTEKSFQKTLEEIQNLPIDHLSLYNMTIEPGTFFFKKKEELKLPTSTLSASLLKLALNYLEKAGFARYEISAFAKSPDKRSRHNLGYWTARPFLGFGPSSFSYWEEERFSNVSHLKEYIKRVKEGIDPVAFRERLSFPQKMTELFAVRLRLFEGVSLKEFKELPQNTLSAISKYLDLKFLEKEGEVIRLTNLGSMFYDSICADII